MKGYLHKTLDNENLLFAFSYICYLIFQLITHPEVVPDEDDDGHVFLDEEGSESKDAHDLISVNSAICLMLIISALVAINCE